MGSITIGQLLFRERNRQRLSASILMEGIGTKQRLYELEKGQQADKQVLDILLQRLGKSPDKLECILSWKEYRFECTRDWFEECVYRKNRKWAERAFRLYEQKASKLGVIGQMYIYRAHAMMAYWLEKDLPEAERWLTLALDATFPRWREPEWYKCRVSTTELENALALVRVHQERVKEAKASGGKSTAEAEQSGGQNSREEEQGEGQSSAAKESAGQDIAEAEGSARQNTAYAEQGEAWDAADADRALLDRCEDYIESHVTDGEENAKIYSKWAWLTARMECREGDDERALMLCVEALDRLRQYSIEYFMLPLLDMIAECQERLRASGENRKARWVWTDEDDYYDDFFDDYEKEASDFVLNETVRNEHYRYYRDSLRHLHEQFGEEWYPKDSILHNCCQKAWHLDFEILRAERCAQGMTQQAAADGTYQNPGEIIKIEQRKRSPRSKHFSELMWKLGMEKERMEGFVVTDSFEVLELRRRIQGLTSRQQYDMAKPLFWKLKTMLDLNYVENRRDVRYLRNIIDMNEGKCSCETVLAGDWELLRKTYLLSPERLQEPPVMKMQRGKVQVYRAPMRNEAEVMNQMAICLKRLKRKDEAIRLYEWVLTTFERSRVKPQYRYHSYGLLLQNLAAYRCSVEKSKKALRFELLCGKISSLGYNYLTLACAMEDDSANREVCRRMIKEAYYLFELSNHYIDQRMVRDYYLENYGEDIETI